MQLIFQLLYLIYVPFLLATVVPDDDGIRGHVNERSRSAVVWDSPSGPGTGCELERSQNAPEPECRRRDSRRQEEVTAFIGLQMRVLWW